MAKSDRLSSAILTIAIIAGFAGAIGLLVLLYEVFSDIGRDDVGSFGTFLRAISSLVLLVASGTQLAFMRGTLRRARWAREVGIWAQVATLLAVASRIDGTLQRQPYDIYFRGGLAFLGVLGLVFLSLPQGRRLFEGTKATQPQQHSGAQPTIEPSTVRTVAGLAFLLGGLGCIGGLADMALMVFAASFNGLDASPYVLQSIIFVIVSLGEFVFGAFTLKRARQAWVFGVFAQTALAIALVALPSLRLLLIGELLPLSMLIYLLSPTGRQTFTAGSHTLGSHTLR